MNWMKYRYTGCRKIFHHPSTEESTETDRSRFLSIYSSHQRPIFVQALANHLLLTRCEITSQIIANSKVLEDRVTSLLSSLRLLSNLLKMEVHLYRLTDAIFIDNRLRSHHTSLTLDFTDDKNRSTQCLTNRYRIVSCVCNDSQDLHTNVDTYARFFTGKPVPS